jgi:hypothetical protein
MTTTVMVFSIVPLCFKSHFNTSYFMLTSLRPVLHYNDEKSRPAASSPSLIRSRASNTSSASPRSAADTGSSPT